MANSNCYVRCPFGPVQTGAPAQALHPAPRKRTMQVFQTDELLSKWCHQQRKRPTWLDEHLSCQFGSFPRAPSNPDNHELACLLRRTPWWLTVCQGAANGERALITCIKNILKAVVIYCPIEPWIFQLRLGGELIISKEIQTEVSLGLF